MSSDVSDIDVDGRDWNAESALVTDQIETTADLALCFQTQCLT